MIINPLLILLLILFISIFVYLLLFTKKDKKRIIIITGLVLLFILILNNVFSIMFKKTIPKPLGMTSSGTLCDRGVFVDDTGNIFDEELTFTPTGVIVARITEYSGDDWLLCDGSDYDPLKYPQLHKALGSPSIPKLPNLQSYVLGGKSSDSTSKLNGGLFTGIGSATEKIGKIPHTHDTLMSGYFASNDTIQTVYVFDGTNTNYPIIRKFDQDDDRNVITSPDMKFIFIGNNSSNVGKGLPHNNIQESVYVNFYIKT